jgi:hypothetical protein
MNYWPIIQAIISYSWLFLTLLLIWRIWRNSTITQRAQQALIAAAVKRAEISAEASHESAETARKLAESVYVLIKEKSV